MNGRIGDSPTPEGRLAAVVMAALYAIEAQNRREGRACIADYADFETALQPYVQKELLEARLDELKMGEAKVTESVRFGLLERKHELFLKLAKLDETIAARAREKK